MKATTVTKLSTASINAIGAWSGQAVKTANSMVKAVDSMFADGVTAAMLTAPSKGESTAFYDTVKVSIAAGFTVATQALLKKDTKGLNDTQKDNKRYWQQQIGSKLKDLRNALTRRESLGEESDGAGGKPASFEARLKRDLTKYIAQIEKLEAAPFSVIEMLKHLKSASALIK